MKVSVPHSVYFSRIILAKVREGLLERKPPLPCVLRNQETLLEVGKPNNTITEATVRDCAQRALGELSLSPAPRIEVHLSSAPREVPAASPLSKTAAKRLAEAKQATGLLSGREQKMEIQELRDLLVAEDSVRVSKASTEFGTYPVFEIRLVFEPTDG